jgi:hypothetical protein
MSRQPDGSGGIRLPWDENKASGNVIVCPNCRNDGMDGSITGRAGQWGILRICKQCGHKWSGGIAVQIADFTDPLPIQGSDAGDQQAPEVQFTGSPHRDPAKNFDPDEDY